MRRLIVDGKDHLRVYRSPEDPLPEAEAAKRQRMIRGAVNFVAALCLVLMAALAVVVGKNVANILSTWPPGPERAAVALVLVVGGVGASCLAGVGMAWLLGRRLGVAYGAYQDWYDEKHGKNEGSGA
jgi:hypothetical protein